MNKWTGSVKFRVAGVTFIDDYPTNFIDLKDPADAARLSGECMAAVLRRNPDNIYDANAIEVHVPSVGMVGHVPAELAAELAAHLDAGEVIAATVSGVAIDPDHPDKPGLDVRVSSLDHLLQQPSNQGAHQPMSISEAVSSFLSGGGGKSASFKAIGDRIKGTIISAEERQQIDLDTDKPAFWDDGKPKMQLVITLQTEDRNDADDDGIRNLYVKGSKKPESKSMTAALIAAIKAAGVPSIDVGGTLAMAYIGDGVASKRGFNPPKQYQAAYKPPAIGADFLADPTPAPAAPAPDEFDLL